MEAFDINNVTFKSLIRILNFATRRKEMKIETWFTSQVKGTHIVLTQTFYTFVDGMKNHNLKV
jgi:hypothetical protein